MNIAFVIMSMELGGGSEHDIVNLTQGLRAAGHRPLVITSGGRLCKDLQSGGVDVVRFPLLTRNPVTIWRRAGALAKILLDNNVDVVNPQSVFPSLGTYWASRIAARAGRSVPNVVTIHMLNRINWWYYRMASALLNRFADHVIVESQCEHDRLRSGGMDQPITVLHNCFPTAQIDNVGQTRTEVRRAMGWTDEQVVFIVPARMGKQKGHEVLFKAIARPEIRRLSTQYYLAGDGPLLEKHKAAVDRLGLEAQVVFGGFRRDLPTLYKGADVFLLSSHWESLPLSIREGMVAGLPVVATDVAGVSEAVEHGESGLLVPPGDPEALAAAIAMLAGRPDLRHKMGERGRTLSDQKFNYEQWIAGTVETMQRVATLRQQSSG